MFDEALSEFEKSCQTRDYLMPVTLAFLDRYDFPGVAAFIASPRYQALLAKIKYN